MYLAVWFTKDQGVKTVYYVPDCMVSQGLACGKGFRVRQCTCTYLYCTYWSTKGLSCVAVQYSAYFFMVYQELRCVEERRLFSV